MQPHSNQEVVVSRKIFKFADNVVLLCIHNETITNEELQTLASAFQNSWSTIATNSNIPSTQLINVVRFLECKIDATADGFADLFRSPGLNKCEFQKTALKAQYATALCIHTLQHTPDLFLTFDTSPDEKELLIDPFGFYAELQHWRRHWWLGGTEHVAYQQLVSAAAVLQMRFFFNFLELLPFKKRNIRIR